MNNTTQSVVNLYVNLNSSPLCDNDEIVNDTKKNELSFRAVAI